MEVDCLDVLNLWSSRHNSRAAVAPILDEVGELAMHFLLLLRIKHIRREANNSADLCAKHAGSLTRTERCFLFTAFWLIVIVSLCSNKAPGLSGKKKCHHGLTLGPTTAKAIRSEEPTTPFRSASRLTPASALHYATAR